MQTLGSYFNVLLMLVPTRWYKWNMEWASQLKRDPQMPVHTISLSMSRPLRWAKSIRNFVTAGKIGQSFLFYPYLLVYLIKWMKQIYSVWKKCRQTRDQTNGHLVDSNTLLVEWSSSSVKRSLYGLSRFEINECGIKSKILKTVYLNIPKFYDCIPLQN